MSARGDDRFPILRTRAYVCVCTLRRHRNARTSFVLSRDLSHKVTAMRASLFLFLLPFFFLRARRLWEFGTCACLYTRRARGPREGGSRGESLWCLERELERWRKEDGRRREGWKDGGRGGKTTGPTLSTAAIRRRIHGNIEHVHRSPLVGCTSYTGGSPSPSASLSSTSETSGWLFARTAFRPAHGDFFFNTWLR